MSSEEEWFKNITSEADAEAIVGKLRERIQFYQDENTKMDDMIDSLKLLMHQNTELLSMLEGSSEFDELTVDSCLLSQQEKLRKHSRYASKIKLCIKMYTNLNEKLLEDIKLIKSEIENSKSKLSNVNITSTDDLKTLEAKAKRYENELLKLEKKYPWLKDSQLNLPDISEQIEKLNNLRNTKEKLIEDLEIYKGLKPDITEAKKQLKEVKSEYEQILKELEKCRY